MTTSWNRLTHPAKAMTKNCQRYGCMGSDSSRPSSPAGSLLDASTTCQHLASGVDRVLAHYEVPIRVRGALEDWITVNPNDIVVADDDGVIVVPARLLADVTARVEEWLEKESGAREEIRTGLALLDALEKYGHL